MLMIRLNPISNEDIIVLSKCLDENYTLTTIDLRGIPINECGIESLEKHLESNFSITDIRIGEDSEGSKN